MYKGPRAHEAPQKSNTNASVTGTQRKIKLNAFAKSTTSTTSKLIATIQPMIVVLKNCRCVARIVPRCLHSTHN